MDLVRWRRKTSRFVLILVLVLFSGLIEACGGGGSDEPQTNAGASTQTDPANEKTWDKLAWGKGKWG